ncbi:MAG: SIR2 family NAD-dependent protein deacylase [Candidatus Nanopelagicales bacterium]
MPGTTDQSQLYVVHGNLAHIHADGYLIPADARLEIGRSWLEVLDDRHAPAVGDTQAGVRNPKVRAFLEGSRLILVTDTSSETQDTQWLIAGMRAALQAAGEVWTGDAPVWGADRPPRERPLLAMPLIGCGRGGFRGQQGRVVLEVLTALDALLPSLPFDLVLVCWTRAQYAAVNRTRTTRGLCEAELPAAMRAEVSALARRAAQGGLALLFGAGVSIPIGVPSWKALLGGLSHGLGLAGVSDLDPVDAATLIRSKLGEAEFREGLASAVKIRRHSLSHALLASLRPTVAITTNYDQGYELAISHVIREPSTAVLPWNWPESPAAPRLLKLHGDIELGSVVLSREDFVTMNATRRPLTALLQEQMLSGHVLAVGTSMSDATLMQAVSEAATLLRSVRQPDTISRVLGTLVMTESHPARAELLRNDLKVIFADTPPAADGAGEGAGESKLEAGAAARISDLFLDRIAMSAGGELPYVADSAFSDLVPGDLEEVAVQARKLRTALDAVGVESDPGWRQLLAALDGVGATSAQ